MGMTRNTWQAHFCVELRGLRYTTPGVYSLWSSKEPRFCQNRSSLVVFLAWPKKHISKKTFLMRSGRTGQQPWVLAIFHRPAGAMAYSWPQWWFGSRSEIMPIHQRSPCLCMTAPYWMTEAKKLGGGRHMAVAAAAWRVTHVLIDADWPSRCK